MFKNEIFLPEAKALFNHSTVRIENFERLADELSQAFEKKNDSYYIKVFNLVQLYTDYFPSLSELQKKMFIELHHQLFEVLTRSKKNKEEVYDAICELVNLNKIVTIDSTYLIEFLEYLTQYSIKLQELKMISWSIDVYQSIVQQEQNKESQTYIKAYNHYYDNLMFFLFLANGYQEIPIAIDIQSKIKTNVNDMMKRLIASLFLPMFKKQKNLQIIETYKALAHYMLAVDNIPLTRYKELTELVDSAFEKMLKQASYELKATGEDPNKSKDFIEKYWTSIEIFYKYRHNVDPPQNHEIVAEIYMVKMWALDLNDSEDYSKWLIRFQGMSENNAETLIKKIRIFSTLAGKHCVEGQFPLAQARFMDCFSLCEKIFFKLQKDKSKKIHDIMTRCLNDVFISYLDFLTKSGKLLDNDTLFKLFISRSIAMKFEISAKNSFLLVKWFLNLLLKHEHFDKKDQVIKEINKEIDSLFSSPIMSKYKTELSATLNGFLENAKTIKELEQELNQHKNAKSLITRVDGAINQIIIKEWNDFLSACQWKLSLIKHNPKSKQALLDEAFSCWVKHAKSCHMSNNLQALEASKNTIEKGLMQWMKSGSTKSLTQCIDSCTHALNESGSLFEWRALADIFEEVLSQFIDKNSLQQIEGDLLISTRQKELKKIQELLTGFRLKSLGYITGYLGLPIQKRRDYSNLFFKTLSELPLNSDYVPREMILNMCLINSQSYDVVEYIQLAKQYVPQHVDLIRIQRSFLIKKINQLFQELQRYHPDDFFFIQVNDLEKPRDELPFMTYAYKKLNSAVEAHDKAVESLRTEIINNQFVTEELLNLSDDISAVMEENVGLMYAENPLFWAEMNERMYNLIQECSVFQLVLAQYQSLQEKYDQYVATLEKLQAIIEERQNYLPKAIELLRQEEEHARIELEKAKEEEQKRTDGLDKLKASEAMIELFSQPIQEAEYEAERALAKLKVQEEAVLKRLTVADGEEKALASRLVFFHQSEQAKQRQEQSLLIMKQSTEEIANHQEQLPELKADELAARERLLLCQTEERLSLATVEDSKKAERLATWERDNHQFNEHREKRKVKDSTRRIHFLGKRIEEKSDEEGRLANQLSLMLNDNLYLIQQDDITGNHILALYELDKGLKALGYQLEIYGSLIFKMLLSRYNENAMFAKSFPIGDIDCRISKLADAQPMTALDAFLKEVGFTVNKSKNKFYYSAEKIIDNLCLDITITKQDYCSYPILPQNLAVAKIIAKDNETASDDLFEFGSVCFKVFIPEKHRSIIVEACQLKSIVLMVPTENHKNILSVAIKHLKRMIQLNPDIKTDEYPDSLEFVPFDNLLLMLQGSFKSHLTNNKLRQVLYTDIGKMICEVSRLDTAPNILEYIRPVLVAFYIAMIDGKSNGKKKDIRKLSELSTEHLIQKIEVHKACNGEKMPLAWVEEIGISLEETRRKLGEESNQFKFSF